MADRESLQMPLLPRRPWESLPWLPSIGLAFLTVAYAMAIFRSLDDPLILTFLASNYAALLLCLWCLLRFKELPPDGSSSREERLLKLCVWALVMPHIAMPSYKVATTLPPAFAVVLCAQANFTTLAAFYMLFVYREAPAVVRDTSMEQGSQSDSAGASRLNSGWWGRTQLHECLEEDSGYFFCFLSWFDVVWGLSIVL